MEIKEYLEKYKTHSPEEFFTWASQGRVMEIRFLNDRYGNKFNNWNLIRSLGERFKLETRFNSIYISEFSHLRKILLTRYSGFPLTRYYNIFMGINPKRKVHVKSKNGLLYKSYYGGLAGTSHIQNILCDIEKAGERKGSASHAEIESCIRGAKFLVDALNLTDYYINVSGNGTHLWIRMEEPIEVPIPNFIEYDDKIKYNLKEEPIFSVIKRYNRFIEHLNKMLQKYNPQLKVDEGAKDFSRIARPPGSWNVKVGKTERAVGTVVKNNKIYNIIKPKYMAVRLLINKDNRKQLERASHTNKHRYNPLTIREAPLCRLLLSKYLPSTLSRNHYLEQSMARLLKDNEISTDEISSLIGEIDVVQRKSVQVDPEYLDDEEPFNSETVNSYCYGCKIDLVYDLLEDVPEINDGFINREHYDNLNSFSWTTVEKMKLDKKIPDSYTALKKLIRELVDKHERSVVFFTLKWLFKDDWEYFDSNKIILQLMNKTRKRDDS